MSKVGKSTAPETSRGRTSPKATGAALAASSILATLTVALLLLTMQGSVSAQTAGGGDSQTAPVEGETEAAGPGVRHTEFTLRVDGKQVIGDLLEVNLKNKNVSTDLLTPGTVASRDEVSDMADEEEAVAAVNGDFFNIGETNAPVGPAVLDGEDLKGAVPKGQRFGPGAPGLSTEDVFGVGEDRTGRIGSLSLEGTISTPDTPLELDGLNQYAVEVGGIGAFTPEWGTATRKRATCGTDTDRSAPCSENTTEVVVENNTVTEVREEPGSGEIPEGSFILVGREAGADTLDEELDVGDRVSLDYDLAPAAGKPYEFAVGGVPILRDGKPIEGLPDAVTAPRTSAGVGADGKRLYLLTVDGRSEDSRGLTQEELAGLMVDFGAEDAANLDGGGSSDLVAQEPGEDEVTVQSDPSDGSERPVPNGVGIFVNTGNSGE